MIHITNFSSEIEKSSLVGVLQNGRRSLSLRLINFFLNCVSFLTIALKTSQILTISERGFIPVTTAHRLCVSIIQYFTAFVTTPLT